MLNLKLAFRTLFKAPFVTLVAILSLALGIGANAAIFSMFDQMLLRPLPVAAGGTGQSRRARSQARLAVLQPGRRLRRGFQLPDVPGSRACAEGVHGIAAHRVFGANLAFRARRSAATACSSPAAISRSSECSRRSAACSARTTTEASASPSSRCLSHAYWATRFGRRDVLNQTIIVNGQPMTIVGVAPRGFDGTTLGVEARGLRADHACGS